MAIITRQQFLERLQDHWKNYAGRFQHLSPQAQAAFLKKQGYATLAGLLGHIAAYPFGYTKGVVAGWDRGGGMDA